MEQLQIKNPCPVVLMRMQKNEGNYHCGSCKKNILDLRKQSPEAIKQQISPDSCVILNSNQLAVQPKLGFYRKMLFSCLTFLSVLGFSVKPLKAQQIQTSQDSVMPIMEYEERQETTLPMTDAERKFALENQEKKTEIKALPPQKKKKKSKGKQYRVVGCPSF